MNTDEQCNTLEENTDEQCYCLTSCVIDCEPFSSSHKPVSIVPCGHTICEDCCLQLLKYTNAKCPFCRGIITQYTINYLALDLIRKMPIFHKYFDIEWADAATQVDMHDDGFVDPRYKSFKIEPVFELNSKIYSFASDQQEKPYSYPSICWFWCDHNGVYNKYISKAVQSILSDKFVSFVNERPNCISNTGMAEIYVTKPVAVRSHDGDFPAGISPETEGNENVKAPARTSPLVRGTFYFVDFDQMIQINRDTRRVRNVGYAKGLMSLIPEIVPGVEQSEEDDKLPCYSWLFIYDGDDKNNEFTKRMQLLIEKRFRLLNENSSFILKAPFEKFVLVERGGELNNNIIFKELFDVDLKEMTMTNLKNKKTAKIIKRERTTSSLQRR